MFNFKLFLCFKNMNNHGKFRCAFRTSTGGLCVNNVTDKMINQMLNSFMNAQFQNNLNYVAEVEL